ncbi:MAG: CDP-diacylglycerol--serine O-phosphatidyltransferase [Flavobacteriales bacterium]
MKKENDIRNFVNIPDYLSIGNALCGVLAIFMALEGQLWVSAFLIVGGAIFDLFDGRVARKLNMASEFGVQLDSLCDVVSFIVAPAVFAYSVLDHDWYVLLILALYIVTGVLRLARYNVTGTTDGGKYFEGVPVPVSILLPFLYFFFNHYQIDLSIWLLVYCIHGILMVSVIKIKKL